MYPTSLRYMLYASSTSIRLSLSGQPSWNMLSSGNAVDASQRIASKQCFARESALSSSNFACICLARSRAFLNDSSVRESSLPSARFQTAPLERGVIPLHHSSRVRGSAMTWSQFGKTYSSQMRWSIFRVSSLLHCALAASAALRLSTAVSILLFTSTA